jgi:ribosomal protein L7Ae-like RNA K-turn-binding protein
VLAGDISPIDVITHIPIVCEDNKVPYIYVPSKEVSHARNMTAAAAASAAGAAVLHMHLV